MLNPKEKIKQVYENNSYYHDPQQAILATTLLNEISKKIYSGPKRFIIEMIQNADDSCFKYADNSLNLNFNLLREDCLIISYNGKPLDYQDVEAICSAGNSTKTSSVETTGYKGIGFKSVFYHSEKVHIVSGEFSFKFDKNHFSAEGNWQSDWGNQELQNNLRKEKGLRPILKPWHICPIWSDNELNEEILSFIKPFNVNFIIFFKRPESFIEISQYLKEIKDNHTYLIFLKSSNISWKIYENNILLFNIIKEKIENDLYVFKDMNSNNESNSWYYYYVNYSIDEEYSKEYIDKLIDNDSVPEKFFSDNKAKIPIKFGVKLIKKAGKFIVSQIDKNKRIIYSFLPTEIKYGFPFLINSYFVLDASRSQIVKNDWNANILSEIPNFLGNFYKKILEKFGNSYSIIAEYPTNMEEYFEKQYKIAYDKIFYKDKNNISVRSKVNEYHYINECYINNFDVSNKQRIENILGKIFKDDVLALNLITQYFKNQGFSYSDNYEIEYEDLTYINDLSKIFKKDYFMINKIDILYFIGSEIFIKSTNVEYIMNVLEYFEKNFKPDDIISIPLLYDDKNNFHSFDKFKITKSFDKNLSEILDNPINERIIKYDDRFELNNEILIRVFNNNKIDYLKKLSVIIEDEESHKIELINNILNYYSEKTSVKIIRILYEKWCDYENKEGSNKKKKKEKNLFDIQRILDSVRDFNFITKGNLYIHRHCICIGQFYSGDNTFDKFSDYNISEEYYIENTDKNLWVKFFKRLELWKEEKMYELKLNQRLFMEMPFYCNKFKNTVKFKKDQEIWINVHPKIISLYEDSSSTLEFIINNYNYLCNNLLDNNNINNKNKTKTPFFNYFLWKVEDYNMIPSNKKTLKKSTDLLSYNVLDQITDKDLKQIYLESLDFPYNNELYNVIIHNSKKLKFKQNLEMNDIIKLLDIFVNIMDGRIINPIDPCVIKKNYFELLLILSNLQKNNFKFMFLDDNDNLRIPIDLYYIQGNLLNVLLDNHIGKNKYKLKLPNYEHIKPYLEFCSNHGVNIINSNKIQFINLERSEEFELKGKLNSFIQLIPMLKKLKINSEEYKKLKGIKFYSTKEIIMSYQGNIISKNEISYYVENNKNIEIFFLKDNVYKSWRHNTILYFIAKWISLSVFEDNRLESKIKSFFTSETNDFDKWLYID